MKSEVPEPLLARSGNRDLASAVQSRLQQLCSMIVRPKSITLFGLCCNADSAHWAVCSALVHCCCRAVNKKRRPRAVFCVPQTIASLTQHSQTHASASASASASLV
jgi:hypothetical protein